MATIGQPQSEYDQMSYRDARRLADVLNRRQRDRDMLMVKVAGEYIKALARVR